VCVCVCVCVCVHEREKQRKPLNTQQTHIHIIYHPPYFSVLIFFSICGVAVEKS